MPSSAVCWQALLAADRHIHRHPETGVHQRRIDACIFWRYRLGLYTGISPILSAALFAVLSAFGVEWLSKRKDMREDSAIAVFWTLGMALGIMFTFLSPGFAPDLSAYLFGNILTITWSDIALLGGLALLLILFFALYLHPIIYVAFDREFARSQGIPVQVFEYVLMMFIALTIVACLRMVGIVLVISLLTVPQMTANLFSHRFHRIIWLSIGIGYLSCLGGLMISFYLNVPRVHPSYSFPSLSMPFARQEKFLAIFATLNQKTQWKSKFSH